VRWNPARENVVVEQYRLRLGCQVELLPQTAFAAVKLPDPLVGRAHFRIQAHEAAVDFLSRLVLLEHRSEMGRRLVVGTAPLERVCQRKLHPDVQFCQEAATLGAPVLIRSSGRSSPL